MERKDDTDWIKRCTTMEMELNQGDVRRRHGGMVLKEDKKRFGLSREDAQSRRKQKEN